MFPDFKLHVYVPCFPVNFWTALHKQFQSSGNIIPSIFFFGYIRIVFNLTWQIIQGLGGKTPKNV